MPDNEYRYQAELPAAIGPFKELLEEYSHIPSEEFEAHMHKMVSHTSHAMASGCASQSSSRSEKVLTDSTLACTQRDKAWAIAPYPGFGLWGFTRISRFTSDPVYHVATSRLTVTGPETQDKLLDIGCGMGQNLRQLAHAGVAPSRLLGSDLHSGLLEVGFELFRDRERMEVGGATFVAGNVLEKPGEAGEGGLRELDGKATIIHAGNLFHLFSWEDQVVAGTRMTKLLRPDAKDPFIFGRQVGSLKPGARTRATRSEELFLHDEATFQALWDEIGQATGTAWKVEMGMLENVPPGFAYLGEAARYTRFVVWKV